MTFLPIVERELRVRARQWPTFWVRVIVGAVGTILCVQQLELGEVFSGAGQGGRLAFQSLVVLAFIICSFGCLATSDAISWERREKTLGLLFLTRLRGADILLGKLVSGSLVVLCALVAFLPVLMIPVLAGGVSGREAFRIGLVLINTTLLSLMAGLLASTWHVQWFKAARAALGLVAALLILPLVGQLFFLPTPAVGLLSPLYGAAMADEPGSPFWISLGLVQLTVWVLFVRACRGLDASLEDERVELKGQAPGSDERLEVLRLAHRPLVYVGVQPIRWLLRRQRGTGALVWAGAISGFLFYGFTMYLPAFGGFAGSSWTVVWPMSFAGSVVSGALFGWAASRFFFEARRSGEFELLVTTPVGARTMVWEQWLYLRRILRWPLVVLLLPTLLQFLMLFVQRYPFGGQRWFTILYGVSLVVSIAATVLSLVALCWAGMWCGLHARTQALAAFQTVAWVKVPPFVLLYGWSLLTSLFFGFFTSASAMATMATRVAVSLVPQIATLVFYVWLIRRMRRRLLGEIREAEALPFGWSGNPSIKSRSFGEAFRRVRHWTPS